MYLSKDRISCWQAGYKTALHLVTFGFKCYFFITYIIQIFKKVSKIYFCKKGKTYLFQVIEKSLRNEEYIFVLIIKFLHQQMM